MRRVIIVCTNYEPSQFPRIPDEANRFYTYGFGGRMGKFISSYMKEYKVEVWRLDNYTDKYNEKVVSGVLYKVYPAHNLFKFGLFSFRVIKDLKKNIVLDDPIVFVPHTHQFVLYQIALLCRKAKIITSHHGEWSPFFVYRNSNGFRKLKALINIVLEKFSMKYVNCFLITDKFQFPYIKKVAPNSMHILYSFGLDVSKFQPIPMDEAKRSLGWNENDKHILYVGKLYKYKQVDVLINIWNELKQKHTNIKLVIIGNESPEHWGEEFYNLAVESGAMVLGRILNTELYRYYSAANVYVLMALREDFFGGIGIAPLESLACNTPVVSYSLRNYAGDNLNEIGEAPSTIEESKNAILKIISHPEYYKNMRESIIKYYSYEVMALKTDNIFKKIIN